jgi:hypothetical protein
MQTLFVVNLPSNSISFAPLYDNILLENFQNSHPSKDSVEEEKIGDENE